MVGAQKKEHEPTQHAGLREGSARVRTCVGCGERVEIPRSEAPSSVLIRLVLGPSGEVAVDAAGGGFGRGAHVHPRPACVERAAQKGLSRAARGKVSLIVSEQQAAASTTDSTADAAGLSGSNAEATGPSASDASSIASVAMSPASLASAIIAAMDRRVQGLIVAAARGRKIAPGTDAVEGADHRGQAPLIVVATDAAAGASLSVVRRAIPEGRCVSWGTKKTLASLCSGADSAKRAEGIAVIAVKDDRIAAAIREAVQAATALMPLASSTQQGSRGSQGSQGSQGANARIAKAQADGAAKSRKRHDATRLGGGEGATDVPQDRARSGLERRADG